MMLVDDHILWMAQIKDKACTSIVRSMEKIAGYVLSSNSQHVAVVGHQGWGAGQDWRELRAGIAVGWGSALRGAG